MRLNLLIVKLSLSNWYPGSGVVLDCIDSFALIDTFKMHDKRIPVEV